MSAPWRKAIETMKGDPLEKFRANLRCRRCKILLSTVQPSVSLVNKFCPDCREVVKTSERAIYRARKNHEKNFSIKCTFCGKIFKPTSSKNAPHGMCPACTKKFREEDERIKKEIDRLRYTKPTTQKVRSIDEKFQNSRPSAEEDRRLPPHLRGLTARERQRLAFERLRPDLRVDPWGRVSSVGPEHHSKPTLRDIDIEKNHPLEKFLPQSSSRFVHKHQVAEDPAERHYYTKIDPESGNVIEVETRGQSFYNRTC